THPRRRSVLAAGGRLHRRALGRAIQPRHLPDVLRDGISGDRRDVPQPAAEKERRRVNAATATAPLSRARTPATSSAPRWPTRRRCLYGTTCRSSASSDARWLTAG